MLEKKHYSNGQRIYELVGNRLTFFYKSGKIKAEGPYVSNQMEDEWKFYRESGQLSQIGHFKGNKKSGSWIRYDINGKTEYNETFENDKMLKKNYQ